tara:strand:- start:117 stop:407 length:291 start_codon:yes stop_codon:yes gene_type:complete
MTDTKTPNKTHPKIKRALYLIKMIRKYSHCWYQFDSDANIIKTPSDRMQTWVNDLENLKDDFCWELNEDNTLPDLWDTYCKANDLDSDIEISNYFA